MPKLRGHRNAAAATMSPLAVSFLVGSVALLSACTPNQPPASAPGTTPPVWTGSPAPSGGSGAEGHQHAPSQQSMTTHLKAPDGTAVATAKFEFNNGFATITIETTGVGQLAPGFHGVHIQVPGHAGEPASGNLTSLQVRKDGTGTLVTTTDAFALEDLLTGEKTAIIIHAGADNFANIPADRYKQTSGASGPDETTMNTGDSGKRVACGVIGAG